MHIKIIRGKFTDRNVRLCYDYLIKRFKEEIARDSDLRARFDGGTRKKRIQHPQPNPNVQGKGSDK